MDLGRLWDVSGGSWELKGGSGRAHGWLWEVSGRSSGRSGVPGMSGMVCLHKVAPLRNGMQKFHFLLLVVRVFGGTTHQVRNWATSEDPQLEDGVAAPTWGAL